MARLGKASFGTGCWAQARYHDFRGIGQHDRRRQVGDQYFVERPPGPSTTMAKQCEHNS